jgi:hypothetical protein
MPVLRRWPLPQWGQTGVGHHAVFDGENAMVADGDLVRVAAQVVQSLLGAGGGGFGIDDPGLAKLFPLFSTGRACNR